MALVPGIGIGVGLLILIIIWALTILAIVALAAVPKARYGIPVALLLSVVITIILLFYPRQSPGEVVNTNQESVDEVYYGRLVLLLLLSLFLAGGGVALFAVQCTDSIYAKEKRTFYVTS